MPLNKSGLYLVLSIVCGLSFAAQPRPFMVNSLGKPIYNYARSICGVNKMLPMITESDEMKKMGTPIGIYRANMDGGVGMCTGTLITKDLFLTAQHCEAKCEDIKVTFGYLKESREETFACKEVVEKGNGSEQNDYMLVRLEGNPGTVWGWYDITDKAVAPNTPLLMIHHPGGTPMKVSINDCHMVEEKDNFVEHRCDTQPGSSGSAILLPNFEKPQETRVVGVHTLGGCDATPTSYNSGPSMRHLVSISPLLKSLVK